MRVAGIVFAVTEVFAQVLYIRDVVIIDLCKQALLHKALDAVFGGEYDVIGTGVGFQGDHHFLIIGKAHIVYLDTGFFGKQIKSFFSNVFFPVEDVDDFVGQSADRQQQGGYEESADELFHVYFTSNEILWLNLYCQLCGG